MLPFPHLWSSAIVEMRPNAPFRATLEVVSIERGRSAARFVLRDTTTGTEYPMFMVDVLDMMRAGIRKGGRITGLWQAGKRGANYGLRLLSSRVAA